MANLCSLVALFIWYPGRSKPGMVRRHAFSGNVGNGPSGHMLSKQRMNMRDHDSIRVFPFFTPGNKSVGGVE